MVTIIDIDGNTYKIVEIGSQVWMRGNLKTTQYNDGANIPNISDSEKWRNINTPAYCWYNNDELNSKDTYGALNNFYTVDTKKLCPDG